MCDLVSKVVEGLWQVLGTVRGLLEDVQRLELQATCVHLNDALRRDLEEVLAKHGGKLDTIGHPTTTLEDYFLHIVEESKAHPGRRYMPGAEQVTAPAAAAPAPAGEKSEKIREGP